ncbi:glycoside hydrolase superfamily [Diplogelasinospora grovesii]|uniref:Glycoside hydrolase superfamily n=1 Tax=Diplogelasinospora grovesii TaxID=303347 RepID=A0AAN6N571_9PEZI|nr:glycoside hydrolase superfamily [Diplogelasinospora grovesii]
MDGAAAMMTPDPYGSSIMDLGRNWWRESIIYEIYVQSFQDTNGDGIGDIPGVIQRLDYLKKLGVDMLWLTPVNKSPFKDQGYDISDYTDINEKFGTLADFEELMAKVHQKGMKIMLDVVFNHTSEEHAWFLESKTSKANPKRSWYFWRPGKRAEDGTLKPPNNWESLFGGPAWTFDETTGEYYLHLFSTHQPDLNWDNPEVRQAVADVCDFWLQKGMDVINLISKVPGLPDADVVDPSRDVQPALSMFTNGPNVHKYLRELNQRVLSKYDICTVGEMPCGVDKDEASLYVARERKELSMVFQFKHMELDSTQGSKWDIRHWELPELEGIFRSWQQHMLGNHGWNALYLENHDQTRALTRFGRTNDPKYRRVCAKMLCTFYMTLRGTPYIYQGQELGMRPPQTWSIDQFRDVETLNYYRIEYQKRKLKDPGSEPDMSDVLQRVALRSRDNVRIPMQWDRSHPNAGFTDPNVEPWLRMGDCIDEINAEREMTDPDSVYAYYKRLIHLRKSFAFLSYGAYVPLTFDDPDVIAFLRAQGPFRSMIICSFSKENIEWEIPHEIKINMAVLQISNYGVEEDVCPRRMKLRPYETRIYGLRAE